MATAHAYRIDTHHHIYPTRYFEQERDRLVAIAPHRAGEILNWTPGRAVEAMDQAGIAAAVTSMPSLGVGFADQAAARSMARECNEYAARMARDYPGRFGVFAALPLPDIEGSLREIEYSLDVLKADGIGLVTNAGGLWPGDAKFAPVFDELQRRRAVVYFHPTAADCCMNLLPGVPPPMLEFPFDTTRAVASLLFGGTLARSPDVRFIFSHAGGALPMLAHRIEELAMNRKNLVERMPNGALHEFRKLYYDIVLATAPIAFNAVRELAGIRQLLYGTDFPYWPIEVTGAGLARLELSAEDLMAIERDNALALLPRLRAR